MNLLRIDVKCFVYWFSPYYCLQKSWQRVKCRWKPRAYCPGYALESVKRELKALIMWYTNHYLPFHYKTSTNVHTFPQNLVNCAPNSSRDVKRLTLVSMNSFKIFFNWYSPLKGSRVQCLVQRRWHVSWRNQELNHQPWGFTTTTALMTKPRSPFDIWLFIVQQ